MDITGKIARCAGRWLAGVVLCVGCGLASANQPNPGAELEALKQAVTALNRELLILEEELLYPASSQVAVYLSLDVGEYFALDGVRLMINGELVASELYSEQQVQALHRGGVQRFYLGNLRTGEHEISAFFTGRGPQSQDYQRAASLRVNKTQSPLVLELRIVDSSARLQPVFDIKEWQM